MSLAKSSRLWLVDFLPPARGTPHLDPVGGLVASALV